MTQFSDDRASEMRDLFFETATELIQALNEEGLELEKSSDDPDVIRRVRRTVHTLKGDSAACGYQELSELAHQLEDLLTPDIAAGGQGALAEVVLIAADTFASMLAAYRANSQAPSGEQLREHILKLTGESANGVAGGLQARFSWSEYERMVIEDALGKGEAVYNVAFGIDPHCPMRGAAMQLIRNVINQCGRLLAIVPDQSTLSSDLDVVEAAVASDHDLDWVQQKCRIPSVVNDLRVEAVTRSAEEYPDDVLDIFRHVTSLEPEPEPASRTMEAAPPEPPKPVSAPVAPRPAAEKQRANAAGAPESVLRVDAARIDSVLNLVGELIIGKSMLHQTISELDRKFPKDPLRGKFADAMAFQARVINDLQKSVMKIRMVPVEQLFRRFPRLVRDISKSCGKEAALLMSGEDTDLDKSILDMLAEPLAHLVRNAVDHGIESPSERIAAGKPVQGTVVLNSYHQGNQIVIEVSDDGRGLDRARLAAKAVELGIITAADAAQLTEGQALNLVFHPGLSTSDTVTAISGRGVGMDIVKNVVERLKGTVTIRTTPGKGSTFYLKVPLTLAIIQALLFRIGDRIYAVPLASVVEITRAAQGDIHLVDHHDVIQLRDQVLTLVHLDSLAKGPARAGRMFVVVVALGDRKFGLVVDQLVGEEELVIKALDDHLVATDLVSGASILGDGTVVLILNIASVVTRMGRSQRPMEATA